MAYVLFHLLINLILLWNNIDATVIECTVYPVMLQPISSQITITLAIANVSNEEVYWTSINPTSIVQFPIRFSFVVTDDSIIAGIHILQLHIYELPRNNYDQPLWSADQHAYLEQRVDANKVTFMAHSTRRPTGSCIIGVIVNTDSYFSNISDCQLNVKIGAMPSVTLNISYPSFPIHFMLTNISIPYNETSTRVSILITRYSIGTIYNAIKTVNLNDNNTCADQNECTALLFKVSEPTLANLTVIMSAHVFTGVSLPELGATYRIYNDKILVFEKTELMQRLEFPFIVPKTMIPISTRENLTIEATIFGPVPALGFDKTLFEGVTHVLLVPGTNNNIKISMLYTGPKIGTTIIGTVHQTPLNQSTWPLVNSSLAFSIADEKTTLYQSYQFIIFDQSFPIQFTLLSINAITQSSQNIVFTVTVTYYDGTTLWVGNTENNRIIVQTLNRLDMNLTITDGYRCQRPGGGYCYAGYPRKLNETCCSEFRCSYGTCQLP